ncbi:MAG: cysteine desulfurase [Deltaproteobacteria bacterium]|nr:cysteine desulfurase [Deltaproteobacteria bacterium]
MSIHRPIYLDHQATTPVDPRVLEAMLPYYREDFGNASSSTHSFGWRAEAAVEDARERIAAQLGASPEEIVFTSGATESNNLAIQGVLAARSPAVCSVVTLNIEHPSVLEACRAQADRGHRVVELAVDAEGCVAPDQVADAIDEQTALVSIAAANSEIGVLQPIDEIARCCRERGVLFHCDAAQAVGKIGLRVDELEIDLLSFSAHKIYGPKGVGVLYVRKRRPRIALRPLFAGGGQERGVRPGTLAVPLIVGLARALDLCIEERAQEAKRLCELRDLLRDRIEAGLPEVILNGPATHRLPGNLNLSFAGANGERLLLSLGDLAVSSGSACSSSSGEPSHVLLALGREKKLARASLRFGLGRGTTREDVEFAAERVIQAVREQAVREQNSR